MIYTPIYKINVLAVQTLPQLKWLLLESKMIDFGLELNHGYNLINNEMIKRDQWSQYLMLAQ